jgi:sulfate permease, SulP family
VLAIFEARRAGLFVPAHILRNVVAGVVVGIVALPLAMAFAIASGAKPEQGLYTAIVAGALVSLFGGTRCQIAGPTGAFVVILSAVTAKYGIDGLQLATLMAGVILLFLGFARLGAVIKFIPDPVIVGFTAGIAVIIFVGQWSAFFGLAGAPGGHFHEKLIALIKDLPHLHARTTVLAVLALALAVSTPRIPGLARLPGSLVALVAATALQSFFEFEGVATIGSAFGGVPQGLPSLTLPQVSIARLIELLGPAFAIAMLGAIESLLSAVVADGMAGSRHDSNQELIGQGLANIAAPLLGGFAATGAIARTATSIRSGASGPLAGVVHSLVLLLVLLFLAPLAKNIPLAALAAILFIVAWNMSEARHFVTMVKRAPRADVVVLLVTFALTVFADLVIAVNIGVILATLYFLRRMATDVEVRRATEEELSPHVSDEKGGPLPPGTLVYRVEGPFFFGAVETFERALADSHTDPAVLVLHFRWVPFIDITGLQALEDAVRSLKKRGVRVMLAGASTQVQTVLDRAGVVDLVGPQNCWPTLAEALSHCRQHERRER